MSTPLENFRYQRGNLACGSVRLDEIAARLGTPTYVYSAKGFLNPLRQLQRGLAPLRHATVCYAVKSCSNLAILKLLGDAGAGADLVSGGELHRALRAGIDPEKMVFSGVGKTADEIRAGLDCGARGVFSFHVESLAELELIDRVTRESGLGPARVALRFNPNINPKTHPYISTGLKKNKFGMNRAEILAAVTRVQSMNHVTLCGLSIHIGSQLLSLSPLQVPIPRWRAWCSRWKRS